MVDSDDCLVPSRRWAIIRTNGNPVYVYIYASPTRSRWANIYTWYCRSSDSIYMHIHSELRCHCVINIGYAIGELLLWRNNVCQQDGHRWPGLRNNGTILILLTTNNTHKIIPCKPVWVVPPSVSRTWGCLSPASLNSLSTQRSCRGFAIRGFVKIFEPIFENVFCKMTTILIWPQCVNWNTTWILFSIFLRLLILMECASAGSAQARRAQDGFQKAGRFWWFYSYNIQEESPITG